MNMRQKLVVVGVDALVLAELAFALYVSAQGAAEDAPAIFLKLFLPTVAVTLILGRMIVKKLATP